MPFSHIYSKSKDIIYCYCTCINSSAVILKIKWFGGKNKILLVLDTYNKVQEVIPFPYQSRRWCRSRGTPWALCVCGLRGTSRSVTWGPARHPSTSGDRREVWECLLPLCSCHISCGGHIVCTGIECTSPVSLCHGRNSGEQNKRPKVINAHLLIIQ